MTARKKREPAGMPDTSRPVLVARGREFVVARVSARTGEITIMDSPVEAAPDPLLSSKQAAKALGVAESTWRTLVSDGYAPAADDPGNDGKGDEPRAPKRWRLSTIDAFKASRPGRGRGPRGINRRGLMRQVREATKE